MDETLKYWYGQLQLAAENIKLLTEVKLADVRKQIDENKALEKTIAQDAVECAHFIDDLKILEMPVLLLDICSQEVLK